MPFATNKIPRSVFFALFTISGFAGLIYESIWSHYLKLFLGHAAYAQTLVLAIFMGGMAVGARICAGYSARWKNLLLGYAVAELVIGLLALLFHGVFVSTIGFAYDTIFPAVGTPFGIDLCKWLIAAILILPQSILLGMTFPLMSAGIMRIYPQTPGSALSMLYFSNSFGAAIGVLVSGFYLIEKFGMPGTLFTAGIVNVALALVVWAICKHTDVGAAPNQPIANAASLRPEGGATAATDARFVYLLLGASLLSGAASFCYEIGWIRMLSLVLGSSTHSFEIMLSAFILGLAFGGLWIKKRIDNYQNVIGVLSIVLVAKGILALATLPVYGATFEVMQLTILSLAKTDFSYSLFNFVSHAISLSVMFPAAFCAGMSLPLITFAFLTKGYGESSIGKVYAWNTLGAIVGVLFAVHIGMPQLGLKGLIIAAAVVDIGIALALVQWLMRTDRRMLIPLSAAGLVAVLLAATFVEFDSVRMASGVYRTGQIDDSSSGKSVFHRDGKTATIDVIKRGSLLSISTNGKPDAVLQTTQGEPNPDEYTMVLAAALPLAHVPNAKRIANIGFGSGLTTHSLLGSSTVASVDTIEIEPAMIEGARLFGPLVERAYSDPRSTIYIDDAKSFFAGRNSKYDLIVSEPSNPWVSGVSSLFSDEFYRQIKTHIEPRGMFVQWLQVYEINTDLVASILKALGRNFSDYVAYDVDGANMLIMAVPEGTVGKLTSAPFMSPHLQAQLKTLSINDIRDLEIRRIGSKKILHPLVQSYGTRANSDYYPVVDLRAPKARFMQLRATELVELGVAPVPVVDMLEGIEGVAPNRAPNSAQSPRIQKALFAQRLKEYFTANDPLLPTKLDSMSQVNLAFVKEGLTNCARDDKNGIWLNRLITVGQTVGSQLPPIESANFWRVLESAKCYRTLSLHQQEWIALLKAAGNRNAGEMAQRAERLLQTAAIRNPEQMEYLVMAAMTGYLAANNRSAAAALWRQHANSIARAGQISLPIRLLASIALEDVKGGAQHSK